MPTTTTTHAGLPAFVADRDSLAMDGGHTIDWANVGEEYRATPGFTVEVTANAAGDAEAVSVVALPYALPAGAVLDFGGDKFARLAEAADAGAEELVVDPLTTALVDGDTAAVKGSGLKMIPAGTRMSGGTSHNDPLVPRDATHAADCILATNANEDSRSDALTGYGVILGGVIYENLLPGASGSPAVIPTAEKTELQTAGVGTGFAFRQYRDNTA